MSTWRERLRQNISDTCEFVVKHGPTLGWGSGLTCSAAAMGASIMTGGADPLVVGQAASFLTKTAIPLAVGGVTGILAGAAADKFKDYCMTYYREWYDQVMQDKGALSDQFTNLHPEAKGRVIHMLREHPQAQELFAKEGLLKHLLENGNHRLSHAMDSADRIARETRASASTQAPTDQSGPHQ